MASTVKTTETTNPDKRLFDAVIAGDRNAVAAYFDLPDRKSNCDQELILACTRECPFTSNEMCFGSILHLLLANVTRLGIGFNMADLLVCPLIKQDPLALRVVLEYSVSARDLKNTENNFCRATRTQLLNTHVISAKLVELHECVDVLIEFGAVLPMWAY